MLLFKKTRGEVMTNGFHHKKPATTKEVVKKRPPEKAKAKPAKRREVK